MKRVLTLIICMSFSLMALAQASGGQIRRPQKAQNHKQRDQGTRFPLIFMILAGCFICLLVWFMISKGNVIENNSTQESRNAVVERINYETSIGGCQYTGPVDEQNRPNGKGEAFFNDGRYYKGNFEHGNLTGSGANFEYSNGDYFLASSATMLSTKGSIPFLRMVVFLMVIIRTDNHHLGIGMIRKGKY